MLSAHPLLLPAPLTCVDHTHSEQDGSEHYWKHHRTPYGYKARRVAKGWKDISTNSARGHWDVARGPGRDRDFPSQDPNMTSNAKVPVYAKRDVHLFVPPLFPFNLNAWWREWKYDRVINRTFCHFCSERLTPRAIPEVIESTFSQTRMYNSWIDKCDRCGFWKAGYSGRSIIVEGFYEHYNRTDPVGLLSFASERRLRGVRVTPAEDRPTAIPSPRSNFVGRGSSSSAADDRCRN